MTVQNNASALELAAAEMAQAAAQLVSLERDIITSATEVLPCRCPAIQLVLAQRPHGSQLAAGVGMCVGVSLPGGQPCQHVNSMGPTSSTTLLQLDEAAQTIKETARSEAAALLERRMAAMEAVLAARRAALEKPPEPEAARGPGADLRFSVTTQSRPVPAPQVALASAHVPALPAVLCLSTQWVESLQCPSSRQNPHCVMQGGGATSTGPSAGDGNEIMLQGFNWESYKHDWYKTLKEQAKRIAEVGIALWRH